MLYGWILSFILAIGIGGGAYFYYINTEATIDNLKAENIAYILAAEASEKVINQLQDEAAANEVAFSDLHIRLEIAEEYQDGLLDILHKHDLTNLASKKPGLIETRVNEGTKKVLSDLERTTTKQ
jgi:hypothetical protein